MTRQTMMESVKKYVKEYAGAVVAACLMYGGILQFVLVRLVNAIIQTGFRDRMPLRDVYYGGPRWVDTLFIAGGIIAITLGILVGLWVNSKSQHAPTS